MNLNLRDHQLKKILVINLMVTTNQIYICIYIHIQKKKEEPKHKTKDGHQITKEKNKRRKKEQKNYKTTRKQLTKW